MTADPFPAALEELARPAENPTEFYRPFLRVFPVSGATISTVGDFLGSETLSASGAKAARLDELQFDLGEGPCWDALATSRPVLEPDLRGHARGVWPSFSEAVVAEDVTSIFAFPLLVGPLRIGAIDLYSEQPLLFDPDQTRKARTMAGIVSRQVLRQALTWIGGDSASDEPGAFSRRLIHQATGMVLVQLDISADDAKLVIQGRAYAEGRPMMEIARDIIDRRLSFLNDSQGIETAE